MPQTLPSSSTRSLEEPVETNTNHPDEPSTNHNDLVGFFSNINESNSEPGPEPEQNVPLGSNEINDLDTQNLERNSTLRMLKRKLETIRENPRSAATGALSGVLFIIWLDTAVIAPELASEEGQSEGSAAFIATLICSTLAIASCTVPLSTYLGAYIGSWLGEAGNRINHSFDDMPPPYSEPDPEVPLEYDDISEEVPNTTAIP